MNTDQIKKEVDWTTNQRAGNFIYKIDENGKITRHNLSSETLKKEADEEFEKFWNKIDFSIKFKSTESLLRAAALESIRNSTKSFIHSIIDKSFQVGREEERKLIKEYNVNLVADIAVGEAIQKRNAEIVEWVNTYSEMPLVDKKHLNEFINK